MFYKICPASVNNLGDHVLHAPFSKKKLWHQQCFTLATSDGSETLQLRLYLSVDLSSESPSAYVYFYSSQIAAHGVELALKCIAKIWIKNAVRFYISTHSCHVITMNTDSNLVQYERFLSISRRHFTALRFLETISISESYWFNLSESYIILIMFWISLRRRCLCYLKFNVKFLYARWELGECFTKFVVTLLGKQR